MKRIFLTLLTTLLLINVFVNPINAEKEIKYYGIDINTIENSLVKRYIGSLILQKENNTFRLIVNNESLGSCSSTGNFSYYPNGYIKIGIGVDIPNQKINFTYNEVKTKTISIEFSLRKSYESEDIDQYLDIYVDGDYAGTRSASTQSPTISFSSVGYSYDSNNYISINDMYISGRTMYTTISTTSNGSTSTQNVSKSLNSSGVAQQDLFIETHVDAQPVNMDYMEGSLPKQTFASAQTIQYSDSQIDNAVSKQDIRLVNNKTGLYADTVVRRTITYWERINDGSAVDDGSYNTQVEPRQVVVVCQWNEDICESARNKYGEAGRLFAVYGSTYSYQAGVEYSGTRLRNVQTYTEPSTSFPTKNNADDVIQYRTQAYSWPSDYTWSDEAWPSYACPSGMCQHTTRKMYSSRVKTWGAWSDYIYSSGGTNTEAGEWDSKTFYAKSTRGWTGWSTWSKDNSCGLFESDCEDESRVRYDTKYATYSDWSSWTSWDTAFFGCSSSTLKECESKEWYRYRTRTHTPASVGTWSGWSAFEYALLGCSESAASDGTKTKECKTTTARAFRKIGDWSGWSSYSTTSCSPTYSGVNNTQVTGCMSKTQKCEKTRSTNGYTYSGYKYTYGSKPSPAYNCSSSTVTSSSCGTKTQYAASCSCTSPSTNKKTCTGSYYDSKTPCTISGCTNRKCSYTSKTVNLSCTRYYCATSRAQAYTSWSSCSYVDGTCGSETSLYTCTSRTVYAERTRSWGSYGNYTLDTTYLNNSLYDYKTQTWYSSRTRTYTPASTGSWSSWTGYVYSSCSETSASDGTLTKDCDSHTEYRSREREYIWHEYTGNYTLTSCSTLDTSSTIPIRYCDSQTQYHKRYMTDWSSYGSYNIEFGSTEYTDCSASNMCRLQSTVKWRIRTRNSWTDWSNYIYTTCTEATTGSILRECRYITQHGYKVASTGNWSSWINTTTSVSPPEGGGRVEYRLKTIDQEDTTAQFQKTETRTVGSKPEMTKSEIEAFANSLDRLSARTKTEVINGAALYSNQPNATYSEISQYLSLNPSYITNSTVGTTFKNSKLFVPYIYIRDHMRADIRTFDIVNFQEGFSRTTSINTAESGNGGSCILIPYEQDISRESKVIYFDYHDPLANYEGNIPSDLEGLEEVINALQNSDLSDEQISVTISRKDIEDMRSWLETHNYVSDNCAMLKQFAYIFDAKTRALINTQNCKVEGN